MTILDSVERPTASADAIALDDRFVAHNYSPLPVVATSAEGAWITDISGRRYLDCLAAYSAVNFGHRHPEIIATAHAQLDRLALVSRAFHSDRLGPFAEALAALCAKDMVLPMNSGAEAVESGIKVARKWGVDLKGVPAGQANIVVARNNFHGRTTTIISFSDDETARRGFGPYMPGFRSVPFGDAAAVADAVDENTVAVLIEPIQGEAGIIVPPDDFLPRVREICTQRTRSSPAWPAPAAPSRASTGMWSPTSIYSVRHSAVAWCRCRRSSPTATCSACCTPASMARPSGVTRWRRRSAAPSWRCCSAVTSNADQPNSVRACMRG